MRHKIVPEILTGCRYVIGLQTTFLEFCPLWHYCPWREKHQECTTIGSSFMNLILKYQPRKWHSKPLHKSFAQHATGLSSFHWKPFTCSWSVISSLSCPYLTPLLNPTPRITLGIMFMHESNHLSAQLLQKPQRSYRPPMQMDTSHYRSNGVLCSWWRIMPFLGALFHCMNQRISRRA